MLRWLGLAWIAAISCIGLPQAFWQYCHSPYWWILFAGSVLVYFGLWYHNKIQRHGVWVFALNVVAAASVFALGWSYADHQLKAQLAQEVTQRQKVEGIVYISSISEGKLDNWRQGAELLLPNENRSLNILLYPKKLYNPEGEVLGLSTEKLQLGRFYQVTLDIKPPHGNVNAGVFDTEKWLLQQGIQGTATVLYSQELSAQQVQSRGWYSFVLQQQKPLAKWRLWVETLRQDYRQHLVGEQTVSQNRALLLGLLTGDRSALNKDTIELYQMMGISHLLAISGPHVLILAMMLTWISMQLLHVLMLRGVMSQLYQYVPKQYVYLPIFLGCVSFYVAFTGFEVPALRTWLIALICSATLLFRIRLSTLNTLILAASIVLWWDCFAILSAAFWLSFAAAAILLLIYQQLQQQDTEGDISWGERIQMWWRLLWQSQWRIFIALLPIVLWQFQAVSLISPLINLVAIPFLSLLIVPMDIVAAVLWQIVPVLGDLIWSLAAACLWGFNTLLFMLQPVAAYLYLPSYLNDLALLSLSIAIAILALPQGLIARFWAAFFVVLACVPQKRPILQLDVLDVGQGQAIVLRTQQHQMLIDTGMGSVQDGFLSMGHRVVVPFLRRQGVQQLDEILLSHLDLDHSGGTQAVIEQLKVKQLRSNVYDATRTHYPNVPFIQCNQGQGWQWDGVQIEILYPRVQQSRKNQNESSCVLLLTTKMFSQEFKILIMGDVGWEGEYALLQDYPDLSADILVLGHHGSRHSSAYDFLAQIDPKLALISAGFDNRYGHPTPETIARLDALNIPYANTADLGAIHIQLNHAQAIWSWHSAREQRQWLLPQRTRLSLNATN
jgi:competence protein ComEC